MPSFTEYVHLIAEGNEAIAVINRINEAIAKMRREASSPINVKVKSEFEQAADGERKVRGEKRQTHDAELAALKKKREEIAAIKAMNKEQGNPSFEIRYGNQASIAQGQRFNEQLAETTRRINRLADAHKHIRDTAKAADVEVSPQLAGRLAEQVANRTEKADAQVIRDAANAEKERIAAIITRQRQEQEGTRRVAEMEAERVREIVTRQQQEEEGTRRVNEMERERIRLVTERINQEIEGEKRVYQMEQDRLRAEQKIAREKLQAQREQERAEQRARRERETAIASARETGIRGVAGEFQRDIRRNVIYGGIGAGEQMLHGAYEADKDRDTAIENVRQAGRTSNQIAAMIDNARKLSLANPGLTASEMITMQQHNIGAFGDDPDSYAKAMQNNQYSARYLAIRKGKVGEDQALSENLAILKEGEELGRIRDPGFMEKLYNAQLQRSQAEGAQYKPESDLTMVRQLKSPKYGLSDETIMNVLPLIGIGEGAARIGNQISQLQRSMSLTGKSLSKTNIATISGTVLSDGKGGYNPEIMQTVAAGNLTALKAITDKFFREKGLNPDDKSPANMTSMQLQLSRAIGNGSAKEALSVMTENLPQIMKEMRNQANAQGLNTPQTATRTLQGSQDALEAQSKNLAADSLAQFNPLMIRTMNGITYIEEQLQKATQSKNFGIATGASIAVPLAAAFNSAFKAAEENPAQAALTASLTANTGATIANTAATSAASTKNLLGDTAKAGGGVLGTVGKVGAIGLAAASIADVAYTAYDVWDKYAKLRDITKAAKSPEGIANYNANTIADDERNLKFWQAQKDTHDAQMRGQPHPAGQTDYVAQRIEEQLAAMVAKFAADKAAPLKFNQAEKDKINEVDGRLGRGANTYGPSKPVYHTDLGVTDLPSADTTGAIKLTKSTATDALAKIQQAGDGAASALNSAGEQVKGGASAAAGSIAAGGESVAGALNQAAAAISGAAARIGQMQGTPAKAPMSTGPANPGPR